MIKFTLLVVSCLVFTFISANAYSLGGQKQTIIKFPKDVIDKIRKETINCVPPGHEHDDLIQVIKDGKSRDDEEFKTFIHCGYKNTGYANADGTINIEAAAPLFPDPDLMRKIMAECDKNRGKTPIENTSKYFECFQENTPYLMDFN